MCCDGMVTVKWRKQPDHPNTYPSTVSTPTDGDMASGKEEGPIRCCLSRRQRDPHRPLRPFPFLYVTFELFGRQGRQTTLSQKSRSYAVTFFSRK